MRGGLQLTVPVEVLLSVCLPAGVGRSLLLLFVSCSRRAVLSIRFPAFVLVASSPHAHEHASRLRAALISVRRFAARRPRGAGHTKLLPPPGLAKAEPRVLPSVGAVRARGAASRLRSLAK